MNKVEQQGLYVASSRRFRIGIPVCWKLCETEQEVQIESPSGKTAVTITTFKKVDPDSSIDSREHLTRFLNGAAVNGKPSILRWSRFRSSARFTDSRDVLWEVVFLTRRKRLLLGTCNSARGAAGDELQQGRRSLESIRL